MTVQIACGHSRGRARSSATGLQILHGKPSFVEYKTASGTSQPTTAAAPDLGEDVGVWDIVNAGSAAVWVTFAASPTAAAGTTWLIPAGSGRSFAATPGDKCAVINA